MERKKLLLLVFSISLIAILAALPFTAACVPEEEAPPEVKTLQIGFLPSLTGYFSVMDAKAYQSALIVADMFNERGGLTINGQKYEVEIVAEDCQSTVDGAAAAATRLVHDKGIKFIAGSLSFFAVAAGTICEPAKVLRSTLHNSGFPGELGQDVPYCFCGGTSSITTALAGMEYIKQAHPEVKTVVLMHPVGSYREEESILVEEYLKEYGISKVGDSIVYPDETMDFSPFVAQIVDLNPDALFQVSGMPPHAGAIIKGLRELGWENLYAMCFPISGSELMAVSGEAAATNAFSLCDVPGAPDTPPLLAEFQNRTMEAFGDVTLINGFAANSVWAMLKAIEAAQSLDTTVVRDTWEQLDTIETVYGTGWMGGEETYGIKHAVSHKMPIQVIDNGEAKFAAWMEIHIP